MTIDLTETKEGFSYKLFRNSLNQLFNSNSTTPMQDIYGQHQILFDFNQKLNLADHLTPADFQENNMSINNETLLSNSVSFASENLSIKDTDLQPRSLNLLQSKLNDHKQDVISINNCSSSSSSTSSSASSSSLSSYPINFLQQQQQQQQQLKLQQQNQLPLNSQFVKNKEIPNPSSGVACVGSYHSVSDISVLSDNENDENVTSFFTNSLNASSGIQTMSTQSYFSNNTNNSSSSNQRSTSNECEFLRPKDPPPLPISKPAFLRMEPHQQITYNNNSNHYLFNSNVNSLSCSSGTSSLSPSPTPSLNNLSSSGMVVQQALQSNLKLKLQHPPQTKSTDPFENSKSMMFGIPRDSPMPSYPAIHSISSLDSPFVDVTLNNCDNLSLYQPQPNVVVVGDSFGDMRKTILMKTNECFPKENLNLVQKTELFKANVKNPNEIASNSFQPIYNNQMYQPSHTVKASTSSISSNLMSSSSANNFLVSSTSSNNIGLSSSSSSSSSISSSTPAIMNKLVCSNTNQTHHQQQQPQQQNPSFLNSSVYSSISVSSNNTSSSNNSNHSSSNYSYTTPNQQHSVNSNNSSTNNEHLFDYSTSNQLKLKQFSSNQPSSPNNYMVNIFFLCIRPI